MSQVVDMVGAMPHVVIPASDGVHVMPLRALTDVASGKLNSSCLTEPVIQALVGEYLRLSKQ